MLKTEIITLGVISISKYHIIYSSFFFTYKFVYLVATAIFSAKTEHTTAPSTKIRRITE